MAIGNSVNGDNRYRQIGVNIPASEITGTLQDSQIPGSIARDTEVVAAVTAHESAADPHPGYRLESAAISTSEVTDLAEFVRDTIGDIYQIKMLSGNLFWDGEYIPTNTGNTTLFNATTGGSLFGMPSLPSRPGILQMRINATNSWVGFNWERLRFFLGNGCSYIEAGATIQIATTLSNATDSYQTLSGIYDQTATINQTNGVYFLYDSQGVSVGSTASPNWQAVIVQNSTRVFVDTGLTVAANTYYELLVTATPTRVDFYINGMLVHSRTSGLPNNSIAITGATQVFKSAGTNTRHHQIDWLSFKYITSR